MESIRNAIAGARGFMSLSAFDTWDGICSGGNSAFVERFCVLFDNHLNRKKESHINTYVAIVRVVEILEFLLLVVRKVLPQALSLVLLPLLWRVLVVLCVEVK